MHACHNPPLRLCTAHFTWQEGSPPRGEPARGEIVKVAQAGDSRLALLSYILSRCTALSTYAHTCRLL
jgi:hypothetical protein